MVVAVEKRGTASGRLRMAVIPDFRTTTLTTFMIASNALQKINPQSLLPSLLRSICALDFHPIAACFIA